MPAAAVTPVTIWPAGFSVSSSQIHFNTADHGTPLLDTLTDAEAAVDYREVVRAILHETDKNFALLSGGVDVPDKFNIRKSQSLDSDGNVVESYSVRITVAATLGSTVAEV